MQRLFFSTSMPVSFSLLLLLNSCMHNQGSSETSIAATHTRCAMPDSTSAPSHTNALIHESSPYLLQHAHNPVDWRPWSEEAWDIRAVYFFFMRRTYNQLEGRVKEHPVHASSI